MADGAVPVRETISLAPQEGPQEAFLASEADIAIYGGAAGSGKSFAVLLWIAYLVSCALAGKLKSKRRYEAVVFRRTSAELKGGGSIWEESLTVFAGLAGGRTKLAPMEWRWPRFALVEFRHMQHQLDVHKHQSKQYATVVFEELTQFLEYQFWYMVSRLRTGAGVRAHIRATCNPDPDSFVRQLIAWWIGPDGLPIESRSGVLRWFVRDERSNTLHWYDSREDAIAAHPNAKPLSLTFISAKLEDNPKGDPTYRERLEALPFVERERLLGRNWDIRASAGTVFKRDQFRVVNRLEEIPGLTTGGVQVLGWARGWDKAATEGGGDWSVGSRVGLLSNGGYVLASGRRRLQGTPAQVFDAMRQCAAADGHEVLVAVPQDPGQAGIVDVHATLREVKGYAVKGYPIRQNKLTYANVWATRVERGLFWIVRDDETELFLEQANGFPAAKVDDDIDSVSLAVMALGDAGDARTGGGTGEGSVADGNW